MDEKKVKVIEICFAGSNSVRGTIFEEHGFEVFKNLHTYKWIILVNLDSFGIIKDECKSMKIENYIIADRRSMVVSEKFNKK
jgi:hypothetical protein